MNPGRVITFYSYKGGVGRTFLLANCAVLLARWGFRVLCVDFDLEAPGLRHYFQPQLSGSEGEGVVDMVLGHLDGAPLAWPGLVEVVGIEGCDDRLQLLGAGLPGGDYQERLRRLDWDALYDQHDFGYVLEGWRREWTEGVQGEVPGSSTLPYDLVLVDSRTGLTDIQGICTAQLPDLLVFLFTPNQQSLEGAIQVVDRARTQRDHLPLERPPFLALPVPSRCDFKDHPDLADKWMATFALELGRFYDDWRGEVAYDRLLQLSRVDYRSRQSFGEELPAIDERPDDPDTVTWRIATIAALLARGLRGGGELAKNRDGFVAGARAGLLLGRDSGFEHELFLSWQREDAAYAAELRAELERHGVRVWMDTGAIGAGDRLFPAIERGLQTCRDLLFLSGAASAASTWQQIELLGFQGAAERDPSRRIFPVLRGGKLPPSLQERVWIDARARPVRDVALDLLGALDRGVGPRSTPLEPALDPLVAWKAHNRRAHAELIPFFPDADARLLAEVYVDLELAICEPPGRGRTEGELRGPRPLRAWLDAPTEGPHAGRWALLGEPGSGKTTTLRHLAWTLAGEPDGPVPLFLPLARPGVRRADPVAVADQELGTARPLTGSLAVALRELARPGADGASRLWLLLDGLDEVPPAEMEATVRWIRKLSTELPGATLVVSSRPIALERHGLGQDFVRAAVQPLGIDGRDALLARLLPAEDARRVQQLLREESNRSLAELGRNPLMLSLIAIVGLEARARSDVPPRNRVGLYHQAIDLVLRRGHGVEKKGVKDPELARRVLRGLALQLQRQGGEAWSQAALDEEIWALRRADEDLNFRVKETWESNAGLLEDIGFNGGVLGPHDGPGAPWRFLHRSLREFLAAEELNRLGDPAIDAWVQGWLASLKAKRDRQGGAAAEPARWGEVFSLLCGLVKEPLRRLEQLRTADESGELVRRALRSVEGLAPRAAVEFLLGTRGWDGEDLAALADNAAPEALRAALWERVQPGAETGLLAALHFAIRATGEEPDRSRFFEACGRALPSAEWVAERLPRVEIPAGSFWMGSPEGVGHDHERPRHRVTLSQGYGLGRTTVTVAAWRAFDPDHRCPGGDEHPVTNVDWFAARLFCAWAGGSLPTEAEWEHACRAGTDTAWSCGDDEAALTAHAWFGEGPKGSAHPVGEKAPNPWGLQDMHGNVWEWCLDRLGAYESATAVDPAGPPSGDRRVLRGGSYWAGADRCRSAFRSAARPGLRNDGRGFRVCFAPRALGSRT